MQNCFYLLFFSPFGAGRQNVLGCCCHCPFSKNCGICKVCTAGLCRQHQSCSWLCCLWISGESIISLNLLLSSVLRLEPLARENLSQSATGLCEDKDFFPSRTVEFSSLILIFLISHVLFGGGMSEQEWLQRLWISFSWANVQSASSGICAWLRCRRNSQESPTQPGLGTLEPCWSPCEEQQEHQCQLECSCWGSASWCWALPAQSPEQAHQLQTLRAQLVGLEGRAFNFNLQPEDPKRSALCRMNGSTGSSAPCTPAPMCFRTAQPFGRVWYHLGILQCTFPSGFCGDRFNNTQGMLYNCRFQLL